MSGWWWYWNSLSGQFGKVALAAAFGSEQLGPAPLVQPGASTSPLAFDHPPEYQAQSIPLALSRSPIVGAVWAGRRRVAGVPGAYGWYGGWIVLTAKSPQAVPGGVGSRPGPGSQEAVSAWSFTFAPAGGV